MPELPEVETTRRGIAPHCEGRVLQTVVVRNASLRWPVEPNLPSILKKQKLLSVTRRAKYLLFQFPVGYLLVHLGMSGSLRVVEPGTVVKTHDHIDLCFERNVILRYNDPRRFGAFVWQAWDSDQHTTDVIYQHALLSHLGPEPLSSVFDARYLKQQTAKRSAPLKSVLMDAKVVVGVGNIYANEALFKAGLHPLKAANKLSLPKAQKLVDEIKFVLSRSIKQGGTTLRDFVGGDGKPGYFAQQLDVYGRGGEPCKHCAKPLTEKRLQNRTTVYCTQCQKG